MGDNLCRKPAEASATWRCTLSLLLLLLAVLLTSFCPVLWASAGQVSCETDDELLLLLFLLLLLLL